MRRFRVFFDVVSESLSLAQISAGLQQIGAPSSHDKGERDPLGTAFPRTIWRLTSDEAGKAATLEQHCAFLRSQIPAEFPSRLARLQDCTAELNVAVFFDTATCTLTLPNTALEFAQDFGATVTVSCYPSDFGLAKPSQAARKRPVRRHSK
jgi:hypothetical protein